MGMLFDNVGNLTKFVIFTLVKLLIAIIVFYFFLNVVMFCFNYPILSNLAKLVQNSVEENGYLPQHDYNAIDIRRQQIQYQSTHQDEVISEIEGDGFEMKGIFKNLTKVVSDIKIVVYSVDSSGNVDAGYPNGDEENDYYMGSSGRTHKKQKGNIMYAGIRFKYRILHPIPFIDFEVSSGSWGSRLASDVNNSDNPAKDLIEGKDHLIDENPWDLDYTANSSDILENEDTGSLKNGGITVIDTFQMKQDYDEDKKGTQASLFINPVITRMVYSDLSQDTNYTDEDK